MRDWLIRLLGGYTFQDLCDDVDTEIDFMTRQIESYENTIEELQALIPVPKKTRGRPKKSV
jgi:hypothetical protein